MNCITKSLFFAIFLMVSSICFAQEQPEVQPEEVAANEAIALEKELKLTPSQAFYVDSILVHNYRAMFDEYQDMQASGRQSPTSYKFVSDKWLEKNLAALKKVLDDQQYIMYLKHIGRGKEYKRGKDGLYYTKEELDKIKAEGKKK